MKTTFPIARTPLRGLSKRERECGREKERWNVSNHSTAFPFFAVLNCCCCCCVGGGAVVRERAVSEMKMEARTCGAGRTNKCTQWKIKLKWNFCYAYLKI